MTYVSVLGQRNSSFNAKLFLAGFLGGKKTGFFSTSTSTKKEDNCCILYFLLLQYHNGCLTEGHTEAAMCVNG